MIDLKFSDESADALYAMNSLLLVPKADLDGVLQELRRVVRPNGLFFCGVYGGQDGEGIWQDDNYELKRFFSFFTDEAIVEVFSNYFKLEDFHTVDIGNPNLHFQFAFVAKNRPLTGCEAGRQCAGYQADYGKSCR